MLIIIVVVIVVIELTIYLFWLTRDSNVEFYNCERKINCADAKIQITPPN